MNYPVKRILLKGAGSRESIPALLFEAMIDVGAAVVVEADPLEFGRQYALGGRSRVYFLKTSDIYEVIDEVEVSDAMMGEYVRFVDACRALHAAASPLGPLGSYAVKRS